MECHKLIPVFKNDDIAAYAIVDVDDYGYINRWRWSLNENGYATRAVDILGTTHRFFMHRVILGLPEGCPMQGDHKNGNRLDNRQDNLREATLEQNAQNRFAQQGKLGGVRFKGVYAHRNSNGFSVRIRVDGKTLYLGSFKDQEVAARVYDTAALQHFGPRAKLNFPEDGSVSAVAPQERPSSDFGELTDHSGQA